MAGSALFPELETELKAARSDYARLSAEVVAAEETYRAAFRDHETAQGRWGAVVVRINRACGDIEGAPGGMRSSALDRLLYQERGRYDDAGRALSRAKQHLSNLRWELECRAEDVTSIEKLLHPPKSPVVKDAAEKPAVQQADDADIIYFPAARTA